MSVCPNCGHVQAPTLLGLTPVQRDLLGFLHERLTDSGVAPSFEEMKEHIGLRSKSGIHRLIIGLEERGAIRRMPHHARAIKIMPAAHSLFLTSALNHDAAVQQ